MFNGGRETNPHTKPTPSIMRKIESQMCQAANASRDWSSANTSVHCHEGVSVVRLHGNKIAEVGEDFITLFDGGWQTTTTKSRLNALLSFFGNGNERVFQRDFKWFITADGWTREFQNGVTLA